MKFGLLLPTRKRVEKLTQLCDSIEDSMSLENDVVLSLWIDDDDGETIDFYEENENSYSFDIQALVKKRVRKTSKMWNVLWRKTLADFYLMMNDDMYFETKKWDIKMRELIEYFDDRIICLCPDHKEAKDQEATFTPYSRFVPKTAIYGVTQEVCEALGYFTWPFARFCFNENWMINIFHHLWMLTNEKRIFYLEDVVIPHQPVWQNLSQPDETFRDIQDFSDKREEKRRFLETYEDRVCEAKKLMERLE